MRSGGWEEQYSGGINGAVFLQRVSLAKPGLEFRRNTSVSCINQNTRTGLRAERDRLVLPATAAPQSISENSPG